MPLHLVKLCVGAASVSDLEDWIGERLAGMAARGEAPEQLHTTRMVPRRVDELLGGGSLYWVIGGEILVRQALRAVRPFVDGDGIGRCHLVLEPRLVPVEPHPRRPFQGWRYLRPEDAPADLGRHRSGVAGLPEAMRRELRELGLV